MGLRMKNLIFQEFTEEFDFQGGVHEKPIYRGDCLKKGAWIVCRFKEGGPWQERGSVFDGELIPQ